MSFSNNYQPYNYLQPYYCREASYTDDDLCGNYGYTYTYPATTMTSSLSEVSSYARAPPPPPPPHHRRPRDNEVMSSGNVDRVAEEFIKMEHKQWSKNMSNRYG